MDFVWISRRDNVFASHWKITREVSRTEVSAMHIQGLPGSKMWFRICKVKDISIRIGVHLGPDKHTIFDDLVQWNRQSLHEGQKLLIILERGQA